MNETLEQISERILNEVSQDGWLCGYDAVEEFARRLVAALGAQEPVAEVSMTHFDDRDWFEINTLKPRETFHNKQPLYAAPVVHADWQMIPKSRYAELIRCCEDMATGKGGWAWRDVLDEHKAMLAAAPEYGE